jgi:2-phosphosulfolactate phosphatase
MTAGNGVVAVSCSPTVSDQAGEWVTVVIDVLRATTTAITAVENDRRCYPVGSLEEAVPLAGRLHDPLLVGELGGNMPYGFHLQNSPVEMARPVSLGRPVILLSTTGTRLLCECGERTVTYAACLRNVRAQADWLSGRHSRVLLVAGESRGEFREEDRLCCARIARRLLEHGFEPYNAFVEKLVEHWGDARDDCFLDGHSVQYLRDTGQYHDVEFTVSHIDDVDGVFELREGELQRTGSP